MSFKIDKGVPIPEIPRTGRKSKYPWEEMKSGDSVLLPIPEGLEFGEAQRRYSNNAREWLRRRRPNWSVVTRREGKGVRVWLMAPRSETPPPSKKGK